MLASRAAPPSGQPVAGKPLCRTVCVQPAAERNQPRTVERSSQSKRTGQPAAAAIIRNSRSLPATMPATASLHLANYRVSWAWTRWLINFLIDHRARLDGAVRGPVPFIGPNASQRSGAGGGRRRQADGGVELMTTVNLDAAAARSQRQTCRCAKVLASMSCVRATSCISTGLHRYRYWPGFCQGEVPSAAIIHHPRRASLRPADAGRRPDQPPILPARFSAQVRRPGGAGL